jgi:hypothetical protein
LRPVKQTQITPRRQDQRHQRRGPQRHERARRATERIPVAAPTETWGDLRARQRREHHEAHLLSVEALTGLDRAILRADRWCNALGTRLEQEDRQLVKTRAALLH